MNETANAVAAREYVEAIGRHDPAAVQSFLDPDVVQTEFPNQLLKDGAQRDLKKLVQSAARAGELLSGERYDVKSIVAEGDNVAVELEWSGTLKKAMGDAAAGQQLHARIAVFLRFRDGQIVEQRNYDCYDPL